MTRRLQWMVGGWVSWWDAYPHPTHLTHPPTHPVLTSRSRSCCTKSELFKRSSTLPTVSHLSVPPLTLWLLLLGWVGGWVGWDREGDIMPWAWRRTKAGEEQGQATGVRPAG